MGSKPFRRQVSRAIEQTAELKGDLSIHLAETSEERSEAYRLRYEVFTCEFGDDRYAIHTVKEFRDVDDGPNCHVLLARVKEVVVGTLRVTVLREWDFIASHKYRFDVLSDFIGVDEQQIRQKVARFDRGVVLSLARGNGVFSRMMNFVESLALQLKSSVLVGTPGIQNARSRAMLSSLGYLEYPVIDTHNGLTGQCIYKIIDRDGLTTK